MFDRLVAAIRTKSREEWIRLLREKWTNIRIWVQEHSELAALACVILGAFIVLAFSLVIWIVVLSAIAGFVVWSTALPQGQDKTGSAEDSNIAENSQNSDRQE